MGIFHLVMMLTCVFNGIKADTNVCGKGYLYTKGKSCLDFIEGTVDDFSLSQADHRKKCQEKGADLVSITDSGKQVFIMSILARRKPVAGRNSFNISYWIGLEFDEDEKKWLWQNKKQSEYSYFETSNLESGFPCVGLQWSPHMYWYWKNAMCDTVNVGRICEKKLCLRNGNCQHICSVEESGKSCKCYPGYHMINLTTCEENDLCEVDFGGCASSKCKSVNGTKKICLCADGSDRCDPLTGKAGVKDDWIVEVEDWIIPGGVLGGLLLVCGILLAVYKIKPVRRESVEKPVPEIEDKPVVVEHKEEIRSFPTTPEYDTVMGSPL